MSVLLTLVGRRTEIDPNLSDLVFDKHLGRISRTIRPIPIEDTKGPSRPSLRVAATIANDRVGERRVAVESREGVERKPLRELEHALCAYGMGSAGETHGRSACGWKFCYQIRHVKRRWAAG